MSSLHPLDSANRLLAIDQPFFQGPPHSSNIGYGATESRAPNQFNQYNEDVKDHIITSIYEHLKNLEKKAAKSEAKQEGQSNAFETIHQKLIELDHRWDVVIDRGNPDCLGAVFDPLFDLGPAMAENQSVLLGKMNTFQASVVRQQGNLIDKVERMELNQLQTTKDVMEQLNFMHNHQLDRHEDAKGQLDNMHDVQSHIMDRLKHVDEVNVEKHEILRAKLEEFNGEQKDVDNILLEKLDKINDNLEDQKFNLMEKMDYMDRKQSMLENKVMRMLNQLQEQQKNAQTSHSQWSLMVYRSQDRIHDRLDVLEKKISQMLERIPNVPDARDNSEERVLTELRDGIAQVGPEEHDAEVFVAPIELPIDQPAELDVGGTLKALWEFLAPLLVVSMFLSFW